MKKSLFFNILLSLLFIAMITIPLAVMTASRTGSISETEKRKLTVFPEISFSSSFFKEFPAQFDKYVNDHFGFRSSIVGAHTYYLFKLFGISPTKMVTVGSKGWYFFNGDAALYDYMGRIQYSKKQLESAFRLLVNRRDWLDSMGIEYLFLPVPNKEPIYDEFLPGKIAANKGRNKYDQIIGTIPRDGSFTNFIDVQKLMLEHKKENQLYLKTDSHWSHDGASLVYQEILKKVRKEYPAIPALETLQTKKWVQNFSGDLAVLMNLRGVVTETAPDLNIRQACETKKLERMSYLKELPQYKDLPASRLPLRGGCKNGKYKVLFIHDSFGRFLHPYFQEQFETVIFVNHFNFEQAKALIEHERPDIVIDQRVGRNLEKALRPDPELEQLMTKRKIAIR